MEQEPTAEEIEAELELMAAEEEEAKQREEGADTDFADAMAAIERFFLS